jgi:hypothetical protein
LPVITEHLSADHPVGFQNPVTVVDLQRWSLLQHGVHVEEVDGEDPGGLGVRELPPGWACAAWRRIDAGSAQDLPGLDCGDRHDEFCQFAVDPSSRPISGGCKFLAMLALGARSQFV